MKRKISYLGMILTTIFVYTYVLAYEADIKEVIIHMSSSDILSFPNEKSEAKLEEVKISSFSLYQLLAKTGVEKIARAYPEFSKDDTVISSAQGIQVRVGDLTKVLILKFKTEEGANQFLEQVKTPASLQELADLTNKLIQEKGLSKSTINDIINEVKQNGRIQNLIRKNKQYPEVELAEPNYPGQYFAVPNDPQLPNQWGLFSGYGGISCISAWDHYKGLNSRAIGILDTGLYPHRDLNFIGDQTNSYDHGTAVAGVASARTDNGLDIAGVVWQHSSSQLRSYFIGAYDNNHPTAGEITNGINRALGECGIMNISAGTPSSSIEMGIAMKNALSGDALVVCANGKQGDATPIYPAVWGFSVGATDENGFWATYSNSNPDVVAPGGKGGDPDYNDIMTLAIVDPWHAYNSGTSFAAPFVSGAAALISGYIYDNFNHFGATRNDIQRILEITAVDRGGTGYDYQYGWGLINVNNALNKVLITGSNRLKHESISGKDWEEQSDVFAMTLIDVPGLGYGTYFVKKHTCYKNVNWQHPCIGVPSAWVNGTYTQGYADMNPQFGEKWGTVVDGSITTTNATLETNVFEIWDFGGDPCGWRPCEPNQVSFNYSVLGHFNMFAPYNAISQLVYNGSTSHHIKIDFSDSNEYHDGYQLYISHEHGYMTVDLPPNCRTYNYSCPWGSANISAQIRPFIGSDYGPWSNITTTHNAPNKPSNLRVSIQHVCGWPAYAKIVPGELYNGLPVEIINDFWVSADSTESTDSLNLMPCCPDHHDPPCFPTNRVKVSWNTPEYQCGEPDYYRVRIQMPTMPIQVYYIGPVYGHEIEFCDWPNFGPQWISVIACKYGINSNETEEMKSMTTGAAICNNYPFGKEAPGDGQGPLANKSTPNSLSLSQNYPNPFNPETNITYYLPSDCHVNLCIFNVIAQKVRTLIDEYQLPGYKTVQWDGKDESGNNVASGIYFYSLQADKYNQVRKMILMK